MACHDAILALLCHQWVFDTLRLQYGFYPHLKEIKYLKAAFSDFWRRKTLAFKNCFSKEQLEA